MNITQSFCITFHHVHVKDRLGGDGVGRQEGPGGIEGRGAVMW